MLFRFKIARLRTYLNPVRGLVKTQTESQPSPTRVHWQHKDSNQKCPVFTREIWIAMLFHSWFDDLNSPHVSIFSSGGVCFSWHVIKGFEPSKTAPVEVGRLSPLFWSLLFIPGGCLEFLTHQQDGIGCFRLYPCDWQGLLNRVVERILRFSVYTGCLIGILRMVYYYPHVTG